MNKGYDSVAPLEEHLGVLTHHISAWTHPVLTKLQYMVCSYVFSQVVCLYYLNFHHLTAEWVLSSNNFYQWLIEQSMYKMHPSHCVMSWTKLSHLIVIKENNSKAQYAT